MTKNQQILAKIGGGSLALLLSLGLGQQAYAVTLVENLSQSNSDTGGITFDDLWQGSSFTTGSSSYNLNSATLLFQEFSASTDLFVRLYSDNSGQPGTVITNFTNPTPITTTLTNNTFTLATPQALAANTTYWLVSGTTGGGEYYWGYTKSFNQTGLPGWTIGDGYVFSSDQSASWDTDPTGGPYQFSLEGTENAPPTSVPEPGSVVALLGLGGLGLASSLKKRK